MYFGFENITVAYGKHTVLEDIILEVPRGRMVALIGRNGCGKSSLLKTVSGAVKPKSGGIIWEGQSLQKLTARQRARQIAYLGQASVTPAEIDVETLVSYGRYPYLRRGCGMTASDREAVELALVRTELVPLRNRMLSSLSGGELQRARIAMNLAQEPSVLILDEPTTHLDIGYQLEILELLRELNRSLGLTVLMVLHDINLAARYADLIYGILDGHIAVSGTPDEVITEESIRALFDIDAEILRAAQGGYPYLHPRAYIHKDE